MTRKIERKKLSNQVYEILKEMIANHRFQPGTRLNVEQITKELGVSRTPVWEAVGRLEQENLVENVPNRGVFMTILTSPQALELYAVRDALEAMAARLAAPRMDAETMRQMCSCLEQQQQVIEKRDLGEYSRLDFQFHSFVYEASGNSCLQEMLEAIKSKMRPIQFSISIEPVLPGLYEHHVRILQALQARDSQQAEAAFREHNQFMIALISKEAEAGRWLQSVTAGNS